MSSSYSSQLYINMYCHYNIFFLFISTVINIDILLYKNRNSCLILRILDEPPMLCKVVWGQDSFYSHCILLFVHSFFCIYSSFTILFVILLYDVSRGLYVSFLYVFFIYISVMYFNLPLHNYCLSLDSLRLKIPCYMISFIL